MPPIALSSAIVLIRRLMCRNSLNFLQRRIHDHRTGGLGGDVAVLTEGDPDRRGGQRRGVVDAIADENRVRTPGLLADQLHLLFRGLTGENRFDAGSLGQVTHLRFSISGDQHYTVEMMLGSQVIDEQRSLGAWFVAELHGGCIPIVDDRDTLEALDRRGQLPTKLRMARQQPVASRDLDRFAVDGPP